MLQLEGPRIKDIKIAYGGMGATTILANKTTSKLCGMYIKNSLLLHIKIKFLIQIFLFLLIFNIKEMG
jgi:hypothetical protein